MATDAQAIELGDVTGNGNDKSWSPADGECWYVEGIRWICDGSGSDDTIYVCQGVVPAGRSPPLGSDGSYLRYTPHGRRINPGIPSNIESSGAMTTLGTYVHSNEKVVCQVREGYTGGSNWEAYLVARRVQ
jgi:hypothetical protein